MMGYSDGWVGMIWVMFFGLVITAGLVFLVIVAVRSTGGRAGNAPGSPGPSHLYGAHPTSRAQQILADRYARGELTTDEYEERLRVIGNIPGMSPLTRHRELLFGALGVSGTPTGGTGTLRDTSTVIPPLHCHV